MMVARHTTVMFRPAAFTHPLTQQLRTAFFHMNRNTSFSDREEFAIFVKTVIMKPFLGYLPDVLKKEQFLDTFLKEIEESDWTWSLDYVRLGIFARK